MLLSSGSDFGLVKILFPHKKEISTKQIKDEWGKWTLVQQIPLYTPTFSFPCNWKFDWGYAYENRNFRCVGEWLVVWMGQNGRRLSKSGATMKKSNQLKRSIRAESVKVDRRRDTWGGPNERQTKRIQSRNIPNFNQTPKKWSSSEIEWWMKFDFSSNFQIQTLMNF